MENRQIQSENSLARQINRHWILRSAGNYLIIDLISAAAAVIGWCAEKEYSALGKFYPGIGRKILFGEGNFPGCIELSSYVFGDHSEPSGTFLFMLMGIFSVILLTQLFIIIKYLLSGSKKAKDILKPLDELAASVNIPAETHSENEHGYNDLRTAIDRMDPMAGTAHIHTGNSDLAELEDAVNSLLDRMRESYNRQTRFVNDASHELRTPIAVIKGYADMLERWGKTDPAILDESITAIKNESEHIGRLTEQLLFLARSDSGRQPVNKDVFSLSAVMKETCEEYRLIDPKHKYSADVRGDFKAYGDVSLIKQVIRILTDNAKKYTPDGGEITLCVRRSVQGEVCFEVSDTGIGMEQSDIEHIFERFYRADPARNRDTGGTGLGLSIAKQIIDRHNGRFEISSCVGIGTKITVILSKIKPENAETLLNEEKTVRSKSFIGR